MDAMYTMIKEFPMRYVRFWPHSSAQEEDRHPSPLPPCFTLAGSLVKTAFMGLFVMVGILGLGGLHHSGCAADVGARPPSAAPSEEGARAEAARAESFIQDLSQEVIRNLTDPELADEDRHKFFTGLFRKNFDTKSISMFALGRFRRQLKEEQLAEYLALFEEHMTDVYASKFKNYHNEEFEVIRSVPNKRGGHWVSSRINHADRKAPPTSINWLVIPQPDGSFKIYDVVVEGVSMSVTQRSEYASIINNSGGQATELITVLRQKLGK